MTTIVARQYEWGCVIGSDMQTTNGDYRPYNGTGLVKQVERGGFVIACSGEAAICDVLMYGWELPALPRKKTDPLHPWMVKTVVPSMREWLRFEGFKRGKHEFSAILAVRGQVFHVESDGSVLTHHDGIYGIGSGSPYAVGALYADATVERALEIAVMNDSYTSGPFTLHEQRR